VDDVVPEVREFVSVIAKVHRESIGKEDRYEFDIPAHLAHLPNDNSWQNSWEEFFPQLMEQMFRFENDAHLQDLKLEVPIQQTHTLTGTAGANRWTLYTAHVWCTRICGQAMPSQMRTETKL